VWILVVVLGLIVAVALVRIQLRRIALASAAGGVVWATASYFVSRAHPNNLMNLSPILTASVLPMLRLNRSSPVAAGARLLMAPILVVIFVGGWAYEWGSVHFIIDPPRDVLQIDLLRPQVQPDLQTAMDRAGVSPHDAIAYVGPEVLSTYMPVWIHDGRRVEESRVWLGASPVEELGLLPANRRDSHLGLWPAEAGWLIDYHDHTIDSAWLSEWIRCGYAQVRSVTVGSWTVTLYMPLTASRCTS
jgi:hypothetical protein